MCLDVESNVMALNNMFGSNISSNSSGNSNKSSSNSNGRKAVAAATAVATAATYILVHRFLIHNTGLKY